MSVCQSVTEVPEEAQSLAEWIRLQCTNRHWSLEQLASNMRVSPRYLGTLQSGRVPHVLLWRLAEVLELDAHILERFAWREAAQSAWEALLRRQSFCLGLTWGSVVQKLGISRNRLYEIRASRTCFRGSEELLRRLAMLLRLSQEDLAILKPVQPARSGSVDHCSSLSRLFREARESKGWSQRTLAQMARVAKKTIINIESPSSSSPSRHHLRTLQRIAAVLECDIPEEYLPIK